MSTPPSRYNASPANQPSPPNPAFPQSASSVRFPGEDGGRSLAEIARCDLDAALQLLVDRAQYITGASGAAIALRRNGKNDMLCRASSGSNAPELGALLSTEYGLSGESVRTRQPLRCDDAERDVRVNREVCRQLGIASVVVMPVVNDDGVLGVFELFSGNVNAFGERDLSAVQRLSELVETAVRLAEAAEKLPEQLKSSETSASAPANESEEDRVLEAHVLNEVDPDVLDSEQPDSEELILNERILDESVLEDIVPEKPKPVLQVNAATAEKLEKPQNEPTGKNIEREVPSSPEIQTPESKAEVKAAADKVDAKTADAQAIAEKTVDGKAADTKAANAKTANAKTSDEKAEVLSAQPKNASPVVVEMAAAAASDQAKTIVAEKVVVAAQRSSAPSVHSAETPQSRKPLFWTAEVNSAADAAKSENSDRSHVPPMLRNLRKCGACGFPVSADRALCVECDEKKWRGQLKPAGKSRQPAASVVPTAKVQETVASNPEPRALAAQSVAARVPASSMQLTPPSVTESKRLTDQPLPPSFKPLPTSSTANLPALPTQPAAEPMKVSSSTFVFSGGLEPSESWLSANKYVIGALVLVCIVVAAFLLLR